MNTTKPLRSTLRRRMGQAAMAAAAMVALASCGTHASTASSPASAPASAPASGSGAGGPVAAVQIVDTAFQPATLSVAVGTKVVWTETGVEPHSVTAVNKAFDSSPECSPITPDKCLHKGDTFSYVFTHPGTYVYYCRVHGTPSGSGMAGTVTVKAG